MGRIDRRLNFDVDYPVDFYLSERHDILFDNLEKQDQENLAVQQYKTFKIAAGKTMKSFLISVGTRLEKFKLSDIAYLTSTDDFKFETFADQKKALFVIIPTADDTFNFIVSMVRQVSAYKSPEIGNKSREIVQTILTNKMIWRVKFPSITTT